MFDERSFSSASFDARSWFFGDVVAVVSLAGGIGHGKPRRKRRFIEEDGRILVFETAEEAQRYLDIKYAEKPQQKAGKRQQKALPQPKKVIEVRKIEALANAYAEYQYAAKVHAATLDYDYARLVAIWHKLIEIEDEEILILL